jgi:coproporphyrinogen III oxidase-like Fe-S oxidoreductase
LAAWEAYRRAVAEGRSPVESEEVLSPEQEKLERAYLGLRTADGVPLSIVPSVHRSAWLAAGWVLEQGGRLRCTPEGWLRLDELVAKLFVAKELAS